MKNLLCASAVLGISSWLAFSGTAQAQLTSDDPPPSTPCQWNYTFVNHRATATYCGDVSASGVIISTSFGPFVNAAAFGVIADGKTPINTALTKAITFAKANGQAGVLLPPGPLYLDTSSAGSTIALDHTALICAGASQTANAVPSPGSPAFGTEGTTFLISDVNKKPFTVGSGVHIENCGFYYPKQTGATPIVYPPLFTEPAGQNMGNDQFIRLRFVNPYDVVAQTSCANAYGDLDFEHSSGYAIHDFLKLCNMPETSPISGLVLDSNLYQNATPNPADWTAANGAFLEVFGDGNGTTVPSSTCVAGIVLGHDSTIYGYGYGVKVDGGVGTSGCFIESYLDTVWDAIPHIVSVAQGGAYAHVQIRGLFYPYQRDNAYADHAAAFSIINPATGFTTDVDIAGTLDAPAAGDVIDITGSAIKNVKFSIGGLGNFGFSTTVGTYYFANINGANIILKASENSVETGGVVGSTYHGFLLTACALCQVNGNTFNGINNPVDPASNTGQIVVVGNAAVNTSSTYAIAGSGGVNINANSNSFDKQNPLIDGTIRLGNGLNFVGETATGLTCSGLGASGTATFLGGGGVIGNWGLIAMTPGGAGIGGSGTCFWTVSPAPGHGIAAIGIPESGSGIWSLDANIQALPFDPSHCYLQYDNKGIVFISGSTYYIPFFCQAY